MKISEFFDELSKLTPDQIAEKFKLDGIKGFTSKSGCPLVRAVYHYCPDYWSGLQVSVGRRVPNIDNWMHYYASLNDPQIMDPVLPVSAQQFAHNFDQGRYPDLELPRYK